MWSWEIRTNLWVLQPRLCTNPRLDFCEALANPGPIPTGQYRLQQEKTEVCTLLDFLVFNKNNSLKRMTDIKGAFTKTRRLICFISSHLIHTRTVSGMDHSLPCFTVEKTGSEG